jgi:exodeoxyribonuclease VII large subunit
MRRAVSKDPDDPGLPFDSPGGDSDAEQAEEEAPLTVSELVGLVGETLERDFGGVMVAGELTSFTRAASGHCYFAISDEGASIDAVMWRSDVRRLAFKPDVGDEVLCIGRVGVYQKSGRMQLYVSSMRPVGEGAAQRAFEELKRKLAAEGLFDEDVKRELPFLPETIGVVTSRSGAALHDILTTLRRRFGRCHVVLSPAVVQGADAPRDICRALAGLELYGRCDVVIVGRGGGAAEDLAAFNDEKVVRAVAMFPVPVVSAVGHEVDVSLSDLAADHRAATPTAAAEAVVPVFAELIEELADYRSRLYGGTNRLLTGLRHQVGSVAGKLRDPAIAVATGRQRVDEAAIRLERALVGGHRTTTARFMGARERLRRQATEYAKTLSARLAHLEIKMHDGMSGRSRRAATRFAETASKLEVLSPLSVLDRGYSLVARASDGKLVRSSSEIDSGDELRLRFRRGTGVATVVSTAAGEEEQAT